MIKCKVFIEECTPTKSTGNAAWDLCAAEDTLINPSSSAKVNLGVAFKFPKTICGIVTHRSSLAFKEDSVLSYGLIDSTFDSELKALVFNHSLGTALHIKKGERFCQIRFTEAYDYEVEFCNFSGDGKDGFGSTGKF